MRDQVLMIICKNKIVMKNKYLILFVIVSLLFSCNDDDEYLYNEYPQNNIFAPSAGALDEESVLRRDFFNLTGVYLIYTDTLASHNTVSISGDTNIIIDLVEPGYSMTNTYGIDKFSYIYYEDIDLKQQAANLIKEILLTKLPEEMYPYSFFLTKDAQISENSYGYYKEPIQIKFYNGMQTTLVALGDLSAMNSNELSDLKSLVLKEMIIAQITKIPQEKFENFYNYSKEYYDIVSWKIPSPYKSVGFLDTYIYSWSIPFNSPEYDIKAYIEEMFSMSKEEFVTKYTDYPICIEKMEEMLKVLSSYGIEVYPDNNNL